MLLIQPIDLECPKLTYDRFLVNITLHVCFHVYIPNPICTLLHLPVPHDTYSHKQCKELYELIGTIKTLMEMMELHKKALLTVHGKESSPHQVLISTPTTVVTYCGACKIFTAEESGFCWLGPIYRSIVVSCCYVAIETRTFEIVLHMIDHLFSFSICQATQGMSDKFDHIILSWKPINLPCTSATSHTSNTCPHRQFEAIYLCTHLCCPSLMEVVNLKKQAQFRNRFNVAHLM